MIPPSVPRTIQTGLKLKSFAGPLETSFRPIGELLLPSGRIAGGDPDYLKDLKTFEGQYRIRSAPVILTLAKYKDGDQRIAAARVELRQGTVARWSEANPDAYGVDSGLGCFLDAQAAQRLARQPPSALARYRDKLRSIIEKNYLDTWSHASLAADPQSGANLMAFSAGFGDGGYGCYIAHDARGNPLALLADFGLLLTQEEIDALEQELEVP